MRARLQLEKENAAREGEGERGTTSGSWGECAYGRRGESERKPRHAARAREPGAPPSLAGGGPCNESPARPGARVPPSSPLPRPAGAPGRPGLPARQARHPPRPPRPLPGVVGHVPDEQRRVRGAQVAGHDATRRGGTPCRPRALTGSAERPHAHARSLPPSRSRPPARARTRTRTPPQGRARRSAPATSRETWLPPPGRPPRFPLRRRRKEPARHGSFLARATVRRAPAHSAAVAFSCSFSFIGCSRSRSFLPSPPLPSAGGLPPPPLGPFFLARSLFPPFSAGLARAPPPPEGVCLSCTR